MNVISRTTRKSDSKSRRGASPKTKKTKRSLSDQVAQKIVEDYIANKRINPGELLPSESEFCEVYGVSRITVRAAIRSIWDQGLVNVRNGVGAMVMPRANEVRHGLDRLASIDTFARETGHEVKTGELSWEVVPADADISRKLQIPVGAEVLQVKRNKMVDGAVVAWIVDTCPLLTVDERYLKKKFEGSILDILIEDEKNKIEYADSEVKPCISDNKIKEQIPGDENGLLLHMDTVAITQNGDPILWGQIWLDPSKFRFAFQRRRIR